MAKLSRLLSVRRFRIMSCKISRENPGKYGKPCPKLPSPCPIHPRSVNTAVYTFMFGYILVAEYIYAVFVPKPEEALPNKKK